jgi:hypothetical protein
MLSWLAKKLIDHNMRRLREGDPSPTVRMYADDVRFSFPGGSSFAPGASNKQELEQWLNRFVALGLQIYPDEVVLKGFPWRQTVCVRGHIHLDDPDAGRVYENRYVIWGHMRLGQDARVRGLRGHREEPGPGRVAGERRQGLIRR